MKVLNVEVVLQSLMFEREFQSFVVSIELQMSAATNPQPRKTSR